MKSPDSRAETGMIFPRKRLFLIVLLLFSLLFILFSLDLFLGSVYLRPGEVIKALFS